MRKLAYLLSIAGHALLLLIVLHSEFRVTIIPEPPRVVELRIAEPPLPYFAHAAALEPPMGTVRGHASRKTDYGLPERGGTQRAPAAGRPFRGGSVFPAASDFSLGSAERGSFRLAPVGKSPDPWAIARVPAAPAQPLRYPPHVLDPLAPGSRYGEPRFAGGVFLIPFDTKEKAVADWTQAVLSRIERNWIVPASARFTYSGRVPITLTIGKNGRSQALAVGDSSLPEILSLAARQAVQASLPLPPLPENLAGETFAFTFVFVYNG